MSEDTMLIIAKSAPESMSKAKWYEEIFKRSEQQRPVGESQAVAFARYVTKTEEGKALFNAHHCAPGPDWQPPERITTAEVPYQTVAMSKLLKLAEEVRANSPQFTKEQAFRKVLDTSEGSRLYREDRNERLGIAVA